MSDHVCCLRRTITTEEPRAWSTIRPGCWALPAWPSSGSTKEHTTSRKCSGDGASSMSRGQRGRMLQLGGGRQRRRGPPWSGNADTASPSNRRDEQEMSVLCLHIVQAAMVYINTLMIQDVLAEPE